MPVWKISLRFNIRENRTLSRIGRVDTLNRLHQANIEYDAFSEVDGAVILSRKINAASPVEANKVAMSLQGSVEELRLPHVEVDRFSITELN